MASLDEAFEQVTIKLKIKQFKKNQKLAIYNILEEKQNVFVNQPTGYL